ncbi:hypothetical protein [Niveibacterium sp.]|uniref:hypothetical protein n=1 Tax=Niveibacterium sp. TaxID=2017444 RepID=UPI0035B43A85
MTTDTDTDTNSAAACTRGGALNLGRNMNEPQEQEPAKPAREAASGEVAQPAPSITAGHWSMMLPFAAGGGVTQLEPAAEELSCVLAQIKQGDRTHLHTALLSAQLGLAQIAAIWSARAKGMKNPSSALEAERLALNAIREMVRIVELQASLERQAQPAPLAAVQVNGGQSSAGGVVVEGGANG